MNFVLDNNGKVLEAVLSSELDLCVLNDESQTYFRYKSTYSEILDLFLCSTGLANKLRSVEVLNDYLMGSDHAPIMCTLNLNQPYKQESIDKSSTRLNFHKADWGSFKEVSDALIGQVYLEEISDLNNLVSKKIIDAANQCIPMLPSLRHKSYPPFIINLINKR